MTTKEQERQAIEKIRKIVEGLGENSYVGFAMEYAIFKAIEQGSKTAELPAREEMKEQREALKQYLESGKKLTEWTAELLKELLDM